MAVLAAGTTLFVSGCGSRLSDATLAQAGGGGPAAGVGSNAAGTSVGSSGTSDGSSGTSDGSSEAGNASSGSRGTGNAATVPGASSGNSGSTDPNSVAAPVSSAAAGSNPATGTVVPGSSTANNSSKVSTPVGGSKAAVKGGGNVTTTASTAPGAGAGTTAGGFAGFNAAIFGGSAPCTPATGSVVPIGNVSTLSGVLGLLFSPVKPALQVFVKAQNACGGLNGHPMQLTVEDDQDDPSTATSDAQDEIQNDHILAFVGNIQVLTIDAMKSVIDSSKVPIIGGDITNDTWFSDPLLFPEGSPPEAISFGFLNAMVNIYHKTNVGDIYCLEVPQACSQIDKGFNALAAQLGATVKSTTQVSITAPSYTSQCLSAQSAGATTMALIVDAPTQVRYAQSCDKVGYDPQYIAYPLGVGNEKEFLGTPQLANTYVPLQTFPWMSSVTPAEKFYQSSVAKYDPGFTTGDAASLGWTSGALLVAASKDLSATSPTSAQLVQSLDAFTGDSDDTLGGLTAPLTFHAGGTPSAPYCLFSVTSNSTDSGWGPTTDKGVCSSVVAPGAPA